MWCMIAGLLSIDGQPHELLYNKNPLSFNRGFHGRLKRLLVLTDVGYSEVAEVTVLTST